MADSYYIMHAEPFSDRINVTIFPRLNPSLKARLAMTLLEKWGIALAQPDGEDGAHRQKLQLMPILDVVTRACNMAERAIDEIADRGWLEEVPEPK